METVNGPVLRQRCIVIRKESMITHARKTPENADPSMVSGSARTPHSGEHRSRLTDNRTETVAQRLLQETANNSPRTLQMKSMQGRVDSASSAPDSGEVLQRVFITEEKNQKKLNRWIGATKTALKDSGENLLLDFFMTLAGGPRGTPWDIEETFPETRLHLRQLLDEDDDGAITTILDEDMPTKALRGPRSGTGYKRLAAWDLDVARGALDPTTHTEFSHVTTNGSWMGERLDTTHGATKGEFGAAFYTVSGHGDTAAKAVRDEFGKNGNVPRDVLTFRIENTELGQLVNGEMDLAAFLVYILQNVSGYPRGTNHMALITRINRLGKALIFPDKTTLVDIDATGAQFSYDTYRAVNGARGGHSIIVGPQARDGLDGIRQIAARGYLGDQIMNEAVRHQSKLGPLNT